MSKKLNTVKGVIHNLLISLSSYTGIPLFVEIQSHGHGTYEIDLLNKNVKGLILTTLESRNQLEYFESYFETELEKRKLDISDFSSIKIYFTYESSRILFLIPCHSYRYEAVVVYNNEIVTDIVEGKGWK